MLKKSVTYVNGVLKFLHSSTPNFPLFMLFSSSELFVVIVVVSVVVHLARIRLQHLSASSFFCIYIGFLLLIVIIAAVMVVVFVAIVGVAMRDDDDSDFDFSISVCSR